jgi:hypothetical protein
MTSMPAGQREIHAAAQLAITLHIFYYLKQATKYLFNDHPAITCFILDPLAEFLGPHIIQ